MLQTIGRQAGEFLEAPRGAVWGAAARVMGPGSDRQAPGFEAAFAAHGGGQTFEVSDRAPQATFICAPAIERVFELCTVSVLLWGDTKLHPKL